MKATVVPLKGLYYPAIEFSPTSVQVLETPFSFPEEALLYAESILKTAAEEFIYNMKGLFANPAQYGFKVISSLRRSCAKSDVHYPVKRWVTPHPGWGPLAVFSRIDFAHNFSTYYFDPTATTIVPCLYFRSQHTYMWKRRNAPRHERWHGPFPEGTRLADAVYCLE